MRALCVCNGAHVRSVTLARLLNKRGLEALACGVDKDYRDDTIAMLFDWSEIIFIQRDSLVKFRKRFATGFMDRPALLGDRWLEGWERKFDTRFDVGPDDWKVPQHPDLLRRMRDKVESESAYLRHLAERRPAIVVHAPPPPSVVPASGHGQGSLGHRPCPDRGKSGHSQICTVAW